MNKIQTVLPDFSDARSRTCRSDDLERLTSIGWVLRETHAEEHQELGMPYTTQEVVNGMSQHLSKQSSPVLVRRVVFVLGRSKHVEVEELRKERDAATTHAAKAKEEARTAKDAQQAAEKAREEMKARCIREEASHVALAERFGRTETKARKLEEDIAKLRKEIGEARFREILQEKVL